MCETLTENNNKYIFGFTRNQKKKKRNGTLNLKHIPTQRYAKPRDSNRVNWKQISLGSSEVGIRLGKLRKKNASKFEPRN